VTNIELIMEVGGSLSEVLGNSNIRVKLEGSLDHERNLFKNGSLESTEMLSQVSGVDGGQGGVLGHTDSKKPEMPLESGVDGEGTSIGIHGGDGLGTSDLHDQDLLLVIPMLVILVLSQESDSRLGIELVGTRHVKIIKEIDELILARGSVSGTSFLLYLLL
jgi:hypothetical protein